MNLDAYLEVIKKDYAAFQNNYSEKTVTDEMQAEFNNKLFVKSNRKYLKVISNNSVHSFIVQEDDKKFKKGDILKAATWNAPARNFARGNIITGDFKNVRWTGLI